MPTELSAVPAFPRVTVVVQDNGAAEVTIQGTSHTVLAPDVAAARLAAVAFIQEHACALVERPVRVETHDPDGTWHLIVHPNGQVEQAQPSDGGQLASPTRHRAPTRAAEPAPDELEPWIDISDGQSLPVVGLMLVGRNPRPRADEHGAHLVSIHDPDLLLSKTHAAVHLDHEGRVWVTDRRSTNGTRVRAGSGAAVTAPPDVPVPLEQGDAAILGGVTLTVRTTADVDQRPDTP